MSARVLVIGFDALEATLVDRWADAGSMPAFAALREEAAEVRLANRLDLLPGAVWPEITSGISSGKRALYYHPRQLHTGEHTPRAVQTDEIDTEHLYWAVVARAGRRAAVVDHTHVAPVPDLGGVQVLEWASHDRCFPTTSDPPGLLAELEQRVGSYPVADCDDHDDSVASYERLLDGLLLGVERKTELLVELLGRDQWDLFTCGIAEAHCVGHQFWHFLDPTSPSHPADAPDRLRDAVPRVYAALDRALARLRVAAGPDATVLVVASHGMGPVVGGPQLLDDVLARIGATRGRAGLRGRLPYGLRRVVKRFVPASRRDALRYSGLADPATRAVPLINNRCGAVRLNLAGREPHGSVQPGAEAEALLDDITAALLELRQPSSGEPIVARVVRAAEAFGPDHHPDVPDLMVTFRRDLGVLDQCTSPRVGHISVPPNGPWMPRSGDHTDEARLWAVGPGVAAGRRPDGDVLDVAPTVCALLGVDAPAAYDGRALDLAILAPA